eukprot:m.338385 g.338385  ORF g.338385 m.338385 type:complete len:304 (+) comp18401_c0_seq1:115-1026(+)
MADEGEIGARTDSYRQTVEGNVVTKDDHVIIDTIPEGKSKTQIAQEAFKKGDVEASRVAHENLSVEKHAGSSGDYVKAVVFGGLDGIITTFAVVASVAGADLGTDVVLIMGFANLIADGVSMGFGEFLSGDAEIAHINQERAREKWEMTEFPEGEISEMIELYEEKGFSHEDAGLIIRTMAKNEEFFIDHMMVQELGMMTPDEDDSPLKQGLAMFVSFMIFGLVPLLSYLAFSTVASKDSLFGIAIGLTIVALFALGAFSSRFNSRSWYSSGLWVLCNGVVAASVAYGVGRGISEIVGGTECA